MTKKVNLPTKNYMKFIVKDQNLKIGKCRRCNQTSETIPHVIAEFQNIVIWHMIKKLWQEDEIKLHW